MTSTSARARNTACFRKGIANYYDVVVNGKVNRGAAWYYPRTSAAARHIQHYSLSGTAR